MDDLIQQLSDRFNLTEKEAREAVEMVMAHVRDQSPDQLESLIAGAGVFMSSALDSAKDVSGDVTAAAQGVTNSTKDIVGSVADSTNDLIGRIGDMFKRF